jgi:hypothetical protein
MFKSKKNDKAKANGVNVINKGRENTNKKKKKTFAKYYSIQKWANAKKSQQMDYPNLCPPKNGRYKTIIPKKSDG